RSRYGLGPNDQRAIDLASAEYFHREATANESAIPKRLRAHLGTGFERLRQPVQVHHGELAVVRIGEPLQLGHAALQRHLAALEPGLGLMPGLEALRPAARRLALAGGLAPADPLARPARSVVRLQVMELHPLSSTSSTRTRW